MAAELSAVAEAVPPVLNQKQNKKLALKFYSKEIIEHKEDGQLTVTHDIADLFGRLCRRQGGRPNLT